MGCDYWDLYERSKTVPFATFANLLSFRDDDQASTNQQCSENEIFDSHEDKCREVICPERHYYNKQNNKCERIYRNIKNVFYQVYYEITLEQEKVDQIKIECSIDCMLDDYFIVEDGMSWIFGFVHQWTLIDALSYIFIILNASQGLFMFLSFGCNGIVRSRIRVKLFGQKTQNTHESDTRVDKEMSWNSRNVAD
ncbi:unnamed protein product [Mytilus coruscus]|uniref:Uncharacterized protein n=1 Tax=Mytilus coruscus TaxID=42192 RepID=A0A6J8ABF4_MYTCO|nr:unnamed protein product [Mytilus coruscus]